MQSVPIVTTLLSSRITDTTARSLDYIESSKHEAGRPRRRRWRMPGHHTLRRRPSATARATSLAPSWPARPVKVVRAWPLRKNNNPSNRLRIRWPRRRQLCSLKHPRQRSSPRIKAISKVRA